MPITFWGHSSKFGFNIKAQQFGSETTHSIGKFVKIRKKFYKIKVSLQGISYNSYVGYHPMSMIGRRQTLLLQPEL